MSPAVAKARFDDLRSRVAWTFPRSTFDLKAEKPADVAPLLDEVDRLAEAGWWAFGFVSYEAAAGLNRDLSVRQPEVGLPLAWFGISTAPEISPVVRPTRYRNYRLGPWSPRWSAQQHQQRVEEVRSQIAAGETFQCNLTTRMSADVRGDFRGFYADLALAQGGAYNAYLDLEQFVIVSASPELFFELTGAQVRMRPMKGTARRGATARHDAGCRAALGISEKERAENVMIVDLLRNDIGQVAATGSVAVTSLCQIEEYTTVYQLTSEISARLRPGVGLTQIFRALFPCGSVTGVPKARTMQIICELEDCPRGVYCGAVGVVAPPSVRRRARFNVAIRTAVVNRHTGVATYGTGGGITWPSVASEEYAELEAKAAILGHCCR